MRRPDAIAKFGRDERGAIIVFFALSLPVLLLTLAFVIDLGLVRLTGNRLQITADAAALAGSSQLPDDDDVASVALAISSTNYPDPSGNPVLKNVDILTGHWDGVNFIEDGTPKDAVEVTTRRAAQNNNPVAAVFAMFAGIDSFEVNRSSVAHVGVRPICESGGFFSNSKIESGSNNDYVSDFCLYGEDGVKISSDNSFGEGVVVGMNDLGDFEQGGKNAGIDEALTEMSEELVLPALVPDIINQMKNSTSNLPDFITKGPVNLSKIEDKTKLVSGTLYVVSDVADFGSDRNISNIAVVAKKEIKLGSNNVVENVVFATPDKLLIGSDNQIGGSDTCGSDEFNVYLFSRSNIEYGSNNIIQGVQMSAGDQLKLGSDISAMSNVYAEAEGSIEYGSAEDMGSCPGGLDSFFSEIVITDGTGNLVLVQ